MFSSGRRYHGLEGYQALRGKSVLAWGVGESFHLPQLCQAASQSATITQIVNKITFYLFFQGISEAAGVTWLS